MHLGLYLHLLHLVGIRKREGTAEVGKTAWRHHRALGYGTVADQLYADVLRLDELIGSLRDERLDLTYGQLAAVFLAHQCRTGL